MSAVDLDALVHAARSGRPRGVGRLISLVERDAAVLPDLAARLAPDSGRAEVLGITGPPGVGKSTLTSALVGELRGTGRRVGVMAIDPSSPFTGGAVLGDRVRMQQHALDSGVYIRSMATRGHLGGLAAAVPLAIRVLEAAGYDVVIVETVGVGQSEVDVAGVADTVLVLLAPGAGDGVQAAKAGVLEVADVFVVNQADRDGVQPLIRELRSMVALGSAAGWRTPIVSTVAHRGDGVPALLAEIDRWSEHQRRTGGGSRRRLERARREVQAVALGAVRARLAARPAVLDDLAAAVRDGRLDPYAAAGELLTPAWQPGPTTSLR